MQREERPLDEFVRRFYALRRGEWVAVAVVMSGIVGVNELVVHDTGNTWSGLTLMSFHAGLLAVHGWRTLARRRQVPGESARQPDTAGQR